MSPKPIVVITGANTGLGYETIKALYKSPTAHEIVVGARSQAKADEAIKTLQSEVSSSPSSLASFIVDVASDESIEKAAKDLGGRYERIDTLVNNAGINLDGASSAGTLTPRQAWNETWNVNVAGTHLFTTSLIPLLLASPTPRLIFITSGTSPLEPTFLSAAPINHSPAAGWPKPGSNNPVTMYRSSKTGMNMMAREWDRVLKEDGVKVLMVSPGLLATGLGGIGGEKLRAMGAEEPSVGGEFVRKVVEGERDGDRGKVVSRMGVQPW